MSDLNIQDKSYIELLQELKEEVGKARLKAILSVNFEIINLYRRLGERIDKSLGVGKWGDKFINKLSKDLSDTFPHYKGFSRTNLYNINQWYIFYKSAEEFVQRLVGQIPWGHNIVIVNKIKSIEIAIWYIEQTIENGWSRNVLIHKIESRLYERSQTKVSNYHRSLPAAHSDLAQSFLKDPHIFNFIDECRDEKELEASLVAQIQKFMLELGKGFAFIGNQYRINVGGEDFFLDLLFYHVKLKAYVIVELKSGKFKPEYVGKMQFYLTAVDKQLRDEGDNPSIGIILCKEKNKMVAEYALDGIKVPLGITDYKVQGRLPDKLASSLPSIKDIEDKFTEVTKSSSENE